MMQKRTLYLSLLLASFLLVFAYSFSAAQTVTFQSKAVPRCTDVTLNITINSPSELSAFEIIFALNGDYSDLTVNFASGLDEVLTERVLQKFGTPDTVRMAAMKINTGDTCLDKGTVVVGQIHFKAKDVCAGSVTVSGATVSGTSCNCVMTASTGFVGCDPLVAIPATVTAGTVTITNQNPTITCPADTTIHWGNVLQFNVAFGDPDLEHGCELLKFHKKVGPAAMVVDSLTGHVTWATGGDDVCTHQVIIDVVDKCGASDEDTLNICVTNTAPVVTFDPTDTLFAVWGITLSGAVVAADADHGPDTPLLYEVVSFNGPTYYGTGFYLNTATGEWTWQIGQYPDYLGTFTLKIKASDGANLCSPCSPANADTGTYIIHVSGMVIAIEKVHDQLQGHNTTASIYLDSVFAVNDTLWLGGFDFLIAYDASALSFTSAEEGALIDDGKFEYFTYRFGPDGNCGSGCPSGMLRVVGMREKNDGKVNPYHIHGPGELVILHFFVTNDRTLECQFVPIRFYWLDCGDNTVADESGNWLYLGIHVFDFLGVELDPDLAEYGYYGPEDSCFDTVFVKDNPDSIKNYPLGAIVFRNGGIDIICAEDIDARGDVNLNNVANEISDAVVFTNYFIYGLAAFTINEEGQMAATDVNADGIVLSVGDLVYLIRIVVGDAEPYYKLSPDVKADFYSDGQIVRVETPTPLGAALLVFNGEVYPTLGDAASGMEIKYAYNNNMTRVLIYSMDHGHAINSGSLLNIEGQGTLVSIEAADYNGATITTNKKAALPTAYALNQNYPNPFNPKTTIELALPTASNWSIAIYNVSGQKVADFSGYSEAGTVTVNWDAANMASGLYFYKAHAGDFSATKKMVLLK